MKKLLFFTGFFIFVLSEIFAAYYLLPFPNSQENSHIGIAYFLNENLWWLRIFSVILILPFYWHEFKPSRWFTKTGTILLSLIAFFIHYLCSHEMRAGSMFKDMETVAFTNTKTVKLFPNQLVLGVSVNGESKAYPIEIIGYHHQINDKIGGKNILVTYCTVCRSGRVYDPNIDGEKALFTLIGMDTYNALFRDNATGSWWRQVTGECVAGPKQGSTLEEILSEQLTLAAWEQKHPDTKILQPDSAFKNEYKGLKEYDEGTLKSSLEGRDFVSGKMKSWVVGIIAKNKNYMVDWNVLTKKKMVSNNSFLLIQYNDNISFSAYAPNGKTFEYDVKNGVLTDKESLSKWNLNGACYKGKHSGEQLKPLRAHQEFRHSWINFHLGSTEVQ